VTYFYKAYR